MLCFLFLFSFFWLYLNKITRHNLRFLLPLFFPYLTPPPCLFTFCQEASVYIDIYIHTNVYSYWACFFLSSYSPCFLFILYFWRRSRKTNLNWRWRFSDSDLEKLRVLSLVSRKSTYRDIKNIKNIYFTVYISCAKNPFFWKYCLYYDSLTLLFHKKMVKKDCQAGTSRYKVFLYFNYFLNKKPSNYCKNILFYSLNICSKRGITQRSTSWVPSVGSRYYKKDEFPCTV